MKKILLLFFLCTSSLVFSANVYFEYPVHGQRYTMLANGTVGVNYHIYTVGSCWTVGSYRARVQKPNGTYSSYYYGQSGGWVFNQVGTYYIKGEVWVIADCTGENGYWMYSNVLTFYIDPYIPPPQFTVSITGPPTRNPYQYGDWTANPLNGHFAISISMVDLLSL